MGDKISDDCRFNTRLIHSKASKGYGQREILPPIAQVTAFQYENMEELEKVFAHKSMGYAYTRIGNPTLSAFEQKINEMKAEPEQYAAAAACQLFPPHFLQSVTAVMR